MSPVWDSRIPKPPYPASHCTPQGACWASAIPPAPKDAGLLGGSMNPLFIHQNLPRRFNHLVKASAAAAIWSGVEVAGKGLDSTAAGDQDDLLSAQPRNPFWGRFKDRWLCTQVDLCRGMFACADSNETGEFLIRLVWSRRSASWLPSQPSPHEQARALAQARYDLQGLSTETDRWGARARGIQVNAEPFRTDR